MDSQRIRLVGAAWLRRLLQRVRPLLAPLNLLLLLCLSAACGGRGSFFAQDSALTETKISAQWLRRQPGRQIGTLGFHLLDGAGQPLRDWGSLSLSREAATGESFELSVVGGAPVPDDLYLYVTYPAADLVFMQAEQDSAWQQQYLLLSVPHRIDDVLVVGLARQQQYRGQPAPADGGALLRLQFLPGAEPQYRSISTVNEDPASAVSLSAVETGTGQLRLGWDELNLGDYNNNGRVEITDLTPIGLHYQQRISQSSVPAELLLIDGSGDGIVNVQDLTKIGANFSRRVEGYQLYRANGLSPAAGDFAPRLPDGTAPSISRSSVAAAASAEQLRQRLHYELLDSASPGADYSWYVRAYSSDGGSPSEGPPSNTVSLSLASGNLPPFWELTSGLVSAAGTSAPDGSGALRLSFGSAHDPEGSAVTYKLRYIAGQQVVGGAGTVELDIPASSLSGDPPYSYVLGGLTRGSYYTLNLQAADAEGARTVNAEQVQGLVPAFGLSPDVWSGRGGNAQRTADQPASQLSAPVKEAWSVSLEGDTHMAQPLISQDGWIGVFNDNGNFLKLDPVDGSVVGIYPAAGLSADPLPELSGHWLVACSLANNLLIYNLDGLAIPNEVSFANGGQVRTEPLILGDYLFAADDLGQVHCLLLSSREEVWSFEVGGVPSGKRYEAPLASDGVYIYALRLDGRLDKLDPGNGASVAHADIESPDLLGPGESLVLDPASGHGFATARTAVAVFALSDLSFSGSLPAPAGTTPSEITLSSGAQPDLVFASYISDGSQPDTYVRAYSIADNSQQWEHVYANATPDTIGIQLSAAVQSFGLSTGIDAFDNSGQQLQHLELGLSRFQRPALSSDSLYLMERPGSGQPAYLRCFRHAEVNNPPEWDGIPGVSLESSDCSSVTLSWNGGTDDLGGSVYAAIYYRAEQQPELEAPFTDTQVIKDIPSASGGHMFTVDGLTPGVRYYFAVRLMDGLFDSSPEFSDAVTSVARTVCWDEETLYLDGGIGDDSLPLGEVFYMRGTKDMLGAMHLIYNDNSDAKLRQFWGTTGTWTSTSDNLHAFTALGFEPRWNTLFDQLVIGYATSAAVGTLTMGAVDTWIDEQFEPTTPVVNPMVSLVLGDQTGEQHGLVYTQLINPALPPDEDYYYLQTDSMMWQPAEELDSANYAGRDIDLESDPADSTKLWLAEQRGTLYTPNRFTPEEGTLLYARGDGMGGFSFQTVDAGDNPAHPDAGKRVQQVLDSSGRPYLAYYDLNSSAAQPTGQLKLAVYNDVDWNVEVVHSFDLSFQDMGGGLQHTYGEISLAVLEDGQGGHTPLIAEVQRNSAPFPSNTPHYSTVVLWEQGAGDVWKLNTLSDPLIMFPTDREPCVMLIDALQRPHIFVATGDPTAPEPKADRILHLWRQE